MKKYNYLLLFVLLSFYNYSACWSSPGLEDADILVSKGPTLRNIPNDILVNIMLYLPGKNITRLWMASDPITRECLSKGTKTFTVDMYTNFSSTSVLRTVTNYPYLTSIDMHKKDFSNGDLLDDLSMLSNLAILRLEYCKLSRLPTRFSQITTLKKLNLKDNNMRLSGTLPHTLTELTLRNCHLKSLTKNLSSLSQLEKLDLSFNCLSYAPSDLLKVSNVANLNKLRTLILHKCNLFNLPANFSQLTNLTELDLTNNFFSEHALMPLKMLTNLRILTVEFVDLIMPSNNLLLQLPEITELYLENNHLPAIDLFPMLLSSSQLRLLNLSGNHLTTLQEDFFVQLPNLTNLDLSNNTLGELPSSIASLNNLIVLKLKDCVLTTLPKFSQFTKLAELDVSYNKLSPDAVSASITSLSCLRILNLYTNNLSTFSDDFFRNLTNLRELILARNRLSSGVLPSSITLLIHLQIFNVTDCNLKPLPSNFTSHFSNLRYFYH